MQAIKKKDFWEHYSEEATANIFRTRNVEKKYVKNEMLWFTSKHLKNIQNLCTTTMYIRVYTIFYGFIYMEIK